MISLCNEEVIKHIDSLKDKQKNDLERKLKSFNSLNWTIKKWTAHCNSVSDLEHADNLNENLLLYFMEELTPLLSAFCDEMSLHLTAVNKLCYHLIKSQEIMTIKDFAINLTV